VTSPKAEDPRGRIILAGMPGSGKTAVGRELAHRLGVELIDIDKVVEARAGRTIREIVEADGEGEFRELERESALGVADEAPADAVIACGGWTLGDTATLAALSRAGDVICLTAEPATLAARLRRQRGEGAVTGSGLRARSGVRARSGSGPAGWSESGARSEAGSEPGSEPGSGPAGQTGSETGFGDLAAAATDAGLGRRPLLSGADPMAMAALLAARRHVYDSLPWQVGTDRRDVPAAAAAVLDLMRAVRSERSREAVPVLAMPVAVPPFGGYSVLIGEGLLHLIGPILAARGLGPATALITDEVIGELHGKRASTSLSRAGLRTAMCTLPPGESAKKPATAVRLAECFARCALDRDGCAVALGGGSVTDTAGFAAAAYMRGIPWVGVPTTLLGMVDASIGGKTGVNLDAGKNLFGAFWHPAVVIEDVGLLATLPAEGFRGGLAEVIKAALIDDPDALSAVRAIGASVRAGAANEGGTRNWLQQASPAISSARLIELVARAASVKARIVSDDPREAVAGRRILLNLGHTFAHALETVSEHAIPHGDAVAMGLVLSARLSAALGFAPPQLADDVRRLLEEVGLPTVPPSGLGLSARSLMAAMEHDKKRRGGDMRFVLPHAPGDVRAHADVPTAAVRAVLGDVLS